MIYFDNEPIAKNDNEDTTNTRTIIQRATKLRGITMTDMRNHYNEGKPEEEQCSAQNLYGKMKRDTFTFTELAEMLDTIGFDVVIRARDEFLTAKANQKNVGKEVETHEERMEERIEPPRAEYIGDLPPISETANGRAETFTTRDNKRIVAAKGGSRHSFVPVTGLRGERYLISGVDALRASRDLDSWFASFSKGGIKFPDESEIESFLFDLIGTYDVKIGVQKADDGE